MPGRGGLVVVGLGVGLEGNTKEPSAAQTEVGAHLNMLSYISFKSKHVFIKSFLDLMHRHAMHRTCLLHYC